MLLRIDLLHPDDELLEDAATIDGSGLKSLDAIPLAAARTLGDELTAVVTYDERMTAAALRLGLPVDAPA
jgi:predicted nucleic acid-binding protein